jgi:hypothetical protein
MTSFILYIPARVILHNDLMGLLRFGNGEFKVTIWRNFKLLLLYMINSNPKNFFKIIGIGHLSNIWNINLKLFLYNSVSKSFRTGRLERKLQMVQLFATRCSCIAILWISLVSFAAMTLFVASQRVFIVVSVYFVIDSARKLLDIPSYMHVSQIEMKFWRVMFVLGRVYMWLCKS